MSGMKMQIWIILMAADLVVYYAAWFYGWKRLGKVALDERARLQVPNPWRDFSYELLAFTASRVFLRITDARARRAFGLTLVMTPVPIALVVGFWIAVS
ncbi:hypothetical protein ACTJI2_17705 [Pseudoxanthomonas sp. 22568]|uniref:hypothetical protein n=1 Tax=Pseudoxanthomonas TaxID=83618 RepID=UPI00193BB619|nr:hypothetical protein [Pseudoxanthomonas beigongshangi]